MLLHRDAVEGPDEGCAIHPPLRLHHDAGAEDGDYDGGSDGQWQKTDGGGSDQCDQDTDGRGNSQPGEVHCRAGDDDLLGDRVRRAVGEGWSDGECVAIGVAKCDRPGDKDDGAGDDACFGVVLEEVLPHALGCPAEDPPDAYRLDDALLAGLHTDGLQ